MKNKSVLLEAVTVCIFYSDFLKYCISNKKYLDRWIIVTVENDLDTIQLCRDFSLEFVISKRAFKNGDAPSMDKQSSGWISKLDAYPKLSIAAQEFVKTIPFNGTSLAKGKCINEGLAMLDRTGWLLHLDCDVVLPSNIRKHIDNIPLTKENKRSLFGLKGRRILGAKSTFRGTLDFKKNQKYHALFYKNWLRYIGDQKRNAAFLSKARLEAALICGIDTAPAPIKEQWDSFVKGKWDQLVYPFDGPDAHHLGFFQLFFSSHCSQYSELSTNIGVDDVLFRESYPKSHRRILDLECVHICLPSSGMLDLPDLDKHVLKIKHHRGYSYLNDIANQKNKKSSKLTKVSECISKQNKGEKLYVVRRDLSKFDVNSLNLDWCIWKETIVSINPKLNVISKDYKMIYEVLPNGEMGWFGFSIYSEKIFKKTRFKFLFFKIRVENLNCEIEVGYGDKNRMEWIKCNKSALKNNTWCKFKIEFTKKNPIDLINTIFSVRSHGIYLKGKLYIGEVYFQ